MKKYVLVANAIILSAIVFSAFTHKRLNPVTFYYNCGAPDQRIECGFTTTGVEHTITSSSYTNIYNWTTTPQGADVYTSNDGSSYIKSFTIDDYESISDGDDDGQISLLEALAAINAQYVSNCTYPSTSASVIVDANNCCGYATCSDFKRADYACEP